MTTTASTRRHKWQCPQPPAPRILHLPTRPRRRHSRVSAARTSSVDRKGRLESLFDQERAFSRSVVPVPVVLLENGECDDGEEQRRDRVVDCEEEGGSGRRSSKAAPPEVALEEEEKWRFQAEVLRAECNLLRMEKEIALRKLDRNRVNLDRTLRSAIHALISGRKKLSEGSNVSEVVEEEIQNLVDKLKELRKGSRAKDIIGVRNCSNFDRQVSVLQRRLEKLGTLSEEKCMEKIREMAEASLSMNMNSRDEAAEDSVPNADSVEILRKKVVGLSKDVLLERMKDDYGAILSTAKSSASSTRQTNKGILHQNEGTCSGQCKDIVRRIVEQVRAETEQWSQMQEMLAQVRDEMEELQASRDFWEDRALDSDTRNHSLRSAAQEWRDRALSSESKVTELQVKVSMLREEIDRLKKEVSIESTREKNLLPLPISSPRIETEKRILAHSLKENQNHRHRHDHHHHHHHQNTISTSGCSSRQKEASSSTADDRRRKVHSCRSIDLDSKRSPLRDIGNSSRQSSRVVFPLSCHQMHSPARRNS